MKVSRRDNPKNLYFTEKTFILSRGAEDITKSLIYTKNLLKGFLRQLLETENLFKESVK